jgi:hypothetical protein
MYRHKHRQGFGGTSPKYLIPDFSNWKNHTAFETAFARLEKDLRTSLGK